MPPDDAAHRRISIDAQMGAYEILREQNDIVIQKKDDLALRAHQRLIACIGQSISSQMQVMHPAIR